MVFVLSPASARSEICAWEVEEAARLGKRILPVNCRPLEGASPPPRLRDLNYIFFYAEPKVPGSGFGTGLAQPGRGSQHRLRLAARAHPLPSARDRVGQGRPASEPAAVRQTISPRQRHGRRVGPRVRPSPRPCTSTSSARAKRRRRRDRAPSASNSRRWRRPKPSARRPCTKPKRR